MADRARIDPKSMIPDVKRFITPPRFLDALISIMTCNFLRWYRSCELLSSLNTLHDPFYAVSWSLPGGCNSLVKSIFCIKSPSRLAADAVHADPEHPGLRTLGINVVQPLRNKTC